VLARIIDASAICKEETVCEVGTGNGILTKELCKRAKRVISYEVDSALYAQAKATLSFQNLVLVNADLFKSDQKSFDVFVSNLPYSKSRHAFEWLVTRKFDRAIVMVQKEFADKLTAKPRDRNYRAISAISSYCFQIKQLFDVQKDCFQPRPMVESTVVLITLKHSIPREIVVGVNRLFSQRNRLASTVAARLGGMRIDFGDRRVDELEPEQIIKLAGMIK
jgi:16S rRNA (adenine1518-N6/adenine1519-N6)-dimethyltransferase